MEMLIGAWIAVGATALISGCAVIGGRNLRRGLLEEGARFTLLQEAVLRDSEFGSDLATEIDEWLNTGLTLERRVTLIRAGIHAGDALAADVQALNDDDLNIMAGLRNNAPNTQVHELRSDAA